MSLISMAALTITALETNTLSPITQRYWDYNPEANSDAEVDHIVGCGQVETLNNHEDWLDSLPQSHQASDISNYWSRDMTKHNPVNDVPPENFLKGHEVTAVAKVKAEMKTEAKAAVKVEAKVKVKVEAKAKAGVRITSVFMPGLRLIAAEELEGENPTSSGTTTL
ncbi:hypothetical protein DFP72DRAFT_850715 [Ephemerocybe angulata]|uniref:Uncharacterized protein n=1 Tax=Ephemerocybe angulata TaxID=980116 RepID=A0A8H6HR12_9AGAR|nr:hypothetical protein DFP72DRAFT_850715 [Tulosesus angulatus]